MAQDNDPWLPFATEVLLAIPTGAVEQAYYGPYNTILFQAFPPQDRYMVSPQTHPNTREAVDFLIEYLIMIERRVVMIVEVKRENILQYEYARVEADLQVRDRFHSMHENITLSEIIGVSIFGRFCRIYRYVPATQQITCDSGDGLQPNRWDIDLHTIQGRVQLETIFHQVRTRVAQEL